MNKSIWKLPFLNVSLIKKIKNNKKIWSRNSVIPSSFLGKFVKVHNGKNFKRFLITRDLIGYKFGKFCSTRTFNLKPKKTNKKIKKK